MEEIDELFQAWADVDLDDVAKRIIKKTQHRITTKIKQQLRQGKDGNDQLLPEYKSKKYAKWKKEKKGSKAPEGTPDYLLSRSLYDSLKLVEEANSFVIESDVPYFDFIKDRGGKPFELNDENFEWYRDEVFYPAFEKELEKRGLL